MPLSIPVGVSDSTVAVYVGVTDSLIPVEYIGVTDSLGPVELL